MSEPQQIIIIGAGGQCKNTSFVIEQCRNENNNPLYDILGFVDDDSTKHNKEIRRYKVLGSIDSILEQHNNIAFAFSIGNPHIVEKIVQKIKAYERKHQKTFKFPNIIHPSAQVDLNEVEMGEGNIIFPNVIFFTEIKIGSFNFFNRSCSISHEDIIGNYCFIHSGVHLSGQITIGNKVWVGVGSTIIQQKTIGDNATIGAGAVVIKNVEANAVMIGNPAKLLKYKK